MQGSHSTQNLSLTNETRAKLGQAVALVEQHVVSGLDPTSAVVKAAQESRLSPGHTHALARFYNTGRTALQLRDDEMDKRAGDFELADGEEAALATSDHYAEPPPVRSRPFAKVACFPEPPEPEQRPARDDRSELRRISQIKAIQHKIAGIEDRIDHEVRLVEVALDRAAGFFRKSAAPSLATVRSFLTSSGESELIPSLNEVASREPQLQKRAAVSIAVRDSSMTNAVRLLRDCYEKTATLIDSLEEHYRENAAGGKQAEALLADIPLPDQPFDIMNFDKPPPVRKIAAGGQTLLNMLTGAISGRAAATKPGPDGSAVRAYLHELDDPQHAQSLQAIRTRSAVEQLMASDPALREYHPDEVLNAVNEISRTAPQLQGAGLQNAAMVRRYLAQGNALSPDDGITTLVTPAQKATEQMMRPLPPRPEYQGPAPKSSPIRRLGDSLSAGWNFVAPQPPDAQPSPDKPKPETPPTPPATPTPGWQPGGNGGGTDPQPTDIPPATGGADPIADWLRGNDQQTPIALLGGAA